MFSKLLMHSPLLAFPLVGLFLFLSVFAIVLFRVWRTAPKEIAADAALPLADDEVGHV